MFTIIILNSFSGRLPISTSLSCFSGVLSCSFVFPKIFLCHLILPDFLFFISMHEVGQACFLILEKWTYVGDVLWVPAAHCPLFTRVICSRGDPYVGCMVPSFVVGPTTVGVLLSVASPQPHWLPSPA